MGRAAGAAGRIRRARAPGGETRGEWSGIRRNPGAENVPKIGLLLHKIFPFCPLDGLVPGWYHGDMTTRPALPVRTTVTRAPRRCSRCGMTIVGYTSAVCGGVVVALVDIEVGA